MIFGISIPQAVAQLALGTVSGTIRDTLSATVPGATATLISETRGTTLPVVTSATNGEFVIPNVSPDRYTLELTHPGFKTLRCTGIAVDAGDRIGLGQLVLAVGAVTENVTVHSEAPLLQTQSGELSFEISRKEVENLPQLNRSFMNLTTILPGITGTTAPLRIGDQGSGAQNSNIMMDGSSIVDTGGNGVIFMVNSESVRAIGRLQREGRLQAEFVVAFTDKNFRR